MDNYDLGRYSEAFAAHQAALRLDPLSLPALANYRVALIARNRLDEADRQMEKLTSIGPYIRANKQGAWVSLGGKWANAVIADLDGLRIDPEVVMSRNYLTWEFAAIGLAEEALAMSRRPLPLVLSMLARCEDAVRVAEARLAEEPESIFAKRDLGLAFAGTGDYARARPILEDMWQRNGERVTAFGLVQIAGVAALIAIRRAAGDEAGAEVLLAAIRDNVRRYRDAGISTDGLLFSALYEEGLADFLSGEREKGLALIAAAAAEGYFILPNEAYLQELYDDPGFAPIRAAQEARQVAERDRFLTLVCADNPYAAIWQPAAATCQRFAVAAGN